MKLPSLPATLLMGTLALGPQAHADEAPTNPPKDGPKTEQTVIVQAPSGREGMQALAAQHGLVLADARTPREPVIRHTKEGTDAAASLVSGYVNSSVQHGRAAAEAAQGALKYGDALQQAKAHARDRTLPSADTLLN